jgi:MYXO-CTERM domain-containing protein
MRSIIAVSIAVVAVGWSSTTEARSFRLEQVPNGAQFGCALCHQNAQGGGPRTGFGSQVESTLSDPKEMAAVNWAAIYDKDGDADGYSNGFELGDPDGTWTIGDPDPEGDVYGPHDRDDSPCGDGVVLNPPEECDGDDLAGTTCEDLGWGPGTLTCNSLCRFNESQCEGWEPPNGATGNNQTTNNQTTNQTANNQTDGTNNDAGATNSTHGPTDDGDLDGESGCSTAPGDATGSIVVLLFGLVLAPLRRCF